MSEQKKQHPTEEQAQPEKGDKKTVASSPSLQQTQNSTRVQIAAVSAHTEQANALKEVREVWSLLRHPGLLQEIALLSASDKAIIDTCAASIVYNMRAEKDRAIFTANTKLNAPPGMKNEDTEHHAFAVIPGGVKRAVQLDEQIKAYLLATNPILVHAAISVSDSNSSKRPDWNAKIFPHPEHPQQSVLVMNTFIPQQQSYGERGHRREEARGVDCQMTLVLPEQAKILQLLTTYPAHARLTPFIVRNAAIALRKNESLAHLDAPIGGLDGIMGEGKAHAICIADFRHLSLAQTTDKPDTTVYKKEYSTVEDFALSAEDLIGTEHQYGIRVNRTKRVRETKKNTIWFNGKYKNKKQADQRSSSGCQSPGHRRRTEISQYHPLHDILQMDVTP